MGNQTSSSKDEAGKLHPSTKTKNNDDNQPPVSATTSKARKTSQHMIHENLAVTRNPLGQDVFEKYEKVKHLTDGSTCQIWLVRKKLLPNDTTSKHDETQEEASPSSSASSLYALKIIQKTDVDDRFLQEMKNEVKILKRLDHPNIVRIYDLFETDKAIYLVMEYCSGGNLLERAPYTEPQVAKIMTKLLSAVHFMHKSKVVHRDLKVDNCMFENTTVDAEPKVIDFGLSKPYYDDDDDNTATGTGKYKMKCRVGTLETMSPEVIKGSYTDKADIWSLGVIAYMLLSNGKSPFQGNTDKELAANIISGQYISMDDKNDPAWNTISKEAKAFVKSLMQYDPTKRETAASALRSSWLNKQYPSEQRKPEESVMNIIRSAVISSGKNDSTLKRVSNMIIAHKSSNELVADLRKAFDAMDTNNQGTINYWEFRMALKRCDFPEKELKELFRDIDVNHTGVVSTSVLE